MLDKKYNYALCISKIDEKAICEFQFACSFFVTQKICIQGLLMFNFDEFTTPRRERERFTMIPVQIAIRLLVCIVFFFVSRTHSLKKVMKFFGSFLISP